MKTIKLLSILLACICTISCNDESLDRFSLKNNDRIIPIEIEGEFHADVLLVRFVNDALSSLAEIGAYCSSKHNCIYYDLSYQSSVGNCCCSCSLENLSADLDLLVYTLDQKYGNSKSIFLYGNGSAASIILYYASKGKYRDSLDGIIINSAIINLKKTIEASKEKVKELLKNELDITIYDALKGRLEWFLKELNDINANNASARGYFIFLKDNFRFIDGFDFETFDFDCSYSYFKDFSNFGRFDIIDEDLTNIVKDIETPILTLWMDDEFLNPLSIGQELFDLLETPDKELHVFEDPCIPYFDESGEYTQTVIEFIEKYK